MAIFTNQATLTYNGSSTNSNIAHGELLDVLAATKTAVEGSYTPGELVTYVVTLRNSGNVPLTGLVVTDILGGYDFNRTTVCPLTYEDGAVMLFANGVPQAAPTVAAGPPLVFSDIIVPAGGDAVIVCQAQVNTYASPAVEGTIENTVTVTGDGLRTPITATETVNADAAPVLSISKSTTPAQVVDDDSVTHIFVIQNFGNPAVIPTDDAAITDTFDPILTALTITFNGVTWTQGVQYNYNEATGLFTTVPGQILVPAATYTQDPVTGAYTAAPGIATLDVTGTAVMLALLVTLQAITKPVGQLVTGSCVNAVLAITVLWAGMSSGITVALVSPICAYLLGIAPNFVTVLPITIGNVCFVVLLRLIAGSNHKPVALVAAAGVKFVVLYVLVVKVICGIASGALLDKTLGKVVVLAPPMPKMLPTMFAWPQLFTALIGGTAALLITPVLRKALHK